MSTGYVRAVKESVTEYKIETYPNLAMKQSTCDNLGLQISKEK